MHIAADFWLAISGLSLFILQQHPQPSGIAFRTYTGIFAEAAGRGYPPNADGIIYTMKKWTSFFVSPFSTEVTVQLRLDPALAATAQQYQIETGHDGVVTNMVIVGPVLENLKNRIESQK